MAGAIEFLSQQSFGQRHTDGVSQTLTQRASGGFHAGSDADFGVSGRARVQLPEVLELFDGKIVARSEEHTSELQSLMRISYAVFCLKKKKDTHTKITDKSKPIQYTEYTTK